MPPNPTIFQIPSRASKAAVLKVIDPAEQSSPNEEPSHVQAKDVIYGTSTLQNLLAPSSVPTDTERALAQEPRHGNNLSSWTPDVYAHRYVPLSFLEINRAPSIHVITTPGVHGVDFYSYISTFAGSDFLSPQPLHGEGINQLVTSSPGEDCLELPDGERNDKLTPKNYRVYFSDRLIRELEAQQLEFQTYNLYGVPLGVRDHAQNIFSLRVPGIRESTPPVNFGDIIMMRQVLIDLNTGLPRGMDLWLATDFTQRYETCPGFTGYQLRPVVVGIDRANEVLDLRIHGLVLSQRLVCNVTFIAQPRFLQSLERAVEDAASEIQQVEALTPLNRSPESPAFESNRIFKDHTLKVLSPLESGAVSRLAKDSLSVGRERQDLPIIGTISESNSRTTSSVKWLHAMLFPGEGNGTLQFTHPSVSFPQTWFDRSLNYEQKVSRAHRINYSALTLS